MVERSYVGIPQSAAVQIQLLTAGEISQNYKAPERNPNVAFASRMLQLGFRLTF